MLKDAVSKEKLEQIRVLYEASFPKSEKKPFELMVEKQKEGLCEFLAIEDEAGGFCGLAIMILSDRAELPGKRLGKYCPT